MSEKYEKLARETWDKTFHNPAFDTRNVAVIARALELAALEARIEEVVSIATLVGMLPNQGARIIVDNMDKYVAELRAKREELLKGGDAN